MQVRLVVASLVLVSACGGGTAERTESSSATEAPSPPAYEMLATLDGAEDTSPYINTLVALGERCNEGGGDLADIAVVTRDVLGQEGIDVTLLSILQGIRDSVPPEAAPTDCDEVAAAWATLRMSAGG